MRILNKYAHQKNCYIIDVWSDTDHAECLETRKSTAAGLRTAMLGTHVVKHWSITQTLIVLSSGEAAGSHALGFTSVLGGLGVTGKRLRIKTDARVAKSLASC